MPRPSKSDSSTYKPDPARPTAIRPASVYAIADASWREMYYEVLKETGSYRKAAKKATAAYDAVLKKYDERYR